MRPGDATRSSCRMLIDAGKCRVVQCGRVTSGGGVCGVASSFPEYVVEIEQHLRAVAGVVRRRGRMLLERYGITPPQFDALVILKGEGELTIGDLSNRLFLAYSTTTDLVDRLERLGYVARRRDDADRRVVRVVMQPAGWDVIERVLDARRAYLASILEPLSDAEKQEVLRVLELLHTRMTEA
jgi:DNA-binding MarR family transcriptional regulator